MDGITIRNDTGVEDVRRNLDHTSRLIAKCHACAARARCDRAKSIRADAF